MSIKPVMSDYLVVMSKDKAEAHFRSDCSYCVKIRKIWYKNKKWRIMVNLFTQDWVALVP